jgi:hypothetical protein
VLSRSQVARRLERSVATVRRIEGVLLFPRRDRRGIYRFDDSEVDDLARKVRAGEVELWKGFSNHGLGRDQWLLAKANPGRHAPPIEQPADWKRDVEEPRRRCSDAEQRVAILTRENEQLRELARELAGLVAEVFPPGALDEIGSDPLEARQPPA